MSDIGKLPPGRHGLTREQVHASQRARLLWGMAEVVAELGYADATVAVVLKRVHVSRQTFYDHFTDKRDCFLAVLDGAGLLLGEALRTAADAGGTPHERLRRVVETYFARLAEQPSLARVFFVESAAAGAAAQRRRIEVQDRIVELVAGTLRDTPEWHAHPDPEFAVRIVVGGISSLVAAAVVADGAPPTTDVAPRVTALAERVLGITTGGDT